MKGSDTLYMCKYVSMTETVKQHLVRVSLLQLISNGVYKIVSNPSLISYSFIQTIIAEYRLVIHVRYNTLTIFVIA